MSGHFVNLHNRKVWKVETLHDGAWVLAYFDHSELRTAIIEAKEMVRVSNVPARVRSPNGTIAFEVQP